MSEDWWLPLANAVTGHSNQTTGSSLLVKQILSQSAPKSPARALRAIRTTLLSGSPVLAGFGNQIDHYTVIAGFTAQRLLLFDSSGRRWIEAKGVGLWDACNSRYCLYAGSLSAVVDDW